MTGGDGGLLELHFSWVNHIHISNCHFENITTLQSNSKGGGLFLRNYLGEGLCNLKIENMYFKNCSASEGGAMYFKMNDVFPIKKEKSNIRNLTFIDNYSSMGGALYIEETVNYTI